MTSAAVVVKTICDFDHGITRQHQQLPLQLQLQPGEPGSEPEDQEASLNNYCWQYCPKKQAQLRDEALAKILVRGSKAGYAEYLRLGQEVLARDSKKTGYFPARMVVKDSTSKRPPQNHIRIHYDGRPEGEYRDIPDSYVYRLPKEDDDDDITYNSREHSHMLLLSPWVLLDEMHNFEMTPLLAYSQVFERTEFRKFRVLYDGTVFEVMDKLGRIVKVKSEWIHQHSTAHPDSIQEAVAAAYAQQKDSDHNHHPKKEQFFDLIYGASHKSHSGKSRRSTAPGGACIKSSASPAGTQPSTPMLKIEESSTYSTVSIPSEVVSVPRIHYVHKNGQSDWLPAAFASAIHVYAEDHGQERLKDCARTIYQRGKLLKVDSKLRHNFVDMVNRCVNPIGYKMEALQFFNPLHQCPQSASAPVVACMFPQEGGFGKWVSFYQSWVLDATNPYATQRTPDGLSKLYGKGDYNSHAIVSWSYCLVPLRTPLFKQRQRSNSSNSGFHPTNPDRSPQNHNRHHCHQQRNHHHHQRERDDAGTIANHSSISPGEVQGLFKKKCRSRKRSRSSGGGRHRNFASAASNNITSPSKRAR